MGTSRARAGNRKEREGEGDSAGASRRVEGLRRRFAKFRHEHESGTRIPDSLRHAALAALPSGNSESEVRRACGVTSNQLARWRKHWKASAEARELEVQAPRVFPVVDDLAGMGLAQARGPVQQDLELCIGG
ncbi:MAG: hypothetical protein JRH20_29230 [Deltaproteobacteria bacterium]|nr:hypothetical protein [Deltaproteobacteria bacterium]